MIPLLEIKKHLDKVFIGTFEYILHTHSYYNNIYKTFKNIILFGIKTLH